MKAKRNVDLKSVNIINIFIYRFSENNGTFFKNAVNWLRLLCIFVKMSDISRTISPSFSVLVQMTYETFNMKNGIM